MISLCKNHDSSMLYHGGAFDCLFGFGGGGFVVCFLN